MIYQGRLIQVSLDPVILPNNKQIELEVVRHPGGAVIVALDANENVCLLRQYRYVAGQQTLWELPAGCIDAGDPTPQATAQRELREEAGLSAHEWIELGTIYPSPGFCDEKLYLYLGRDLQQGATQHQTDELIQVHWLPFAEALEMARNGQIQDAKSVVGLFRAAAVLDGS